MAGIGQIATSLGRAAARLLFPPVCAGCRRQVDMPGALCGECWPKLRFLERPWCAVLGTPFAYEMGEGALSPEAIANPPAFDRARAAFRFDDVGRALIHGLKYGDRLEVAVALSGWMAAAGRDLLAEADALVPVPLHWTRLVARRFNQAAELTRHLSARTGLANEALLLKRVRRTRHQVGLTRAQRLENVTGAFRIAADRRGWVRGKRLVLVDDVLTTGATLEACCRVLRRAGAARIDVLTAARVVEGPFAVHI
jgi:ComF family protein